MLNYIVERPITKREQVQGNNMNITRHDKRRTKRRKLQVLYVKVKAKLEEGKSSLQYYVNTS